METEAEQVPQTSLLDCLTYAVKTDVGKKREENQDSNGVLESPQFRVFSVADGMGGVKGGAVASKLAISSFEEQIFESDVLSEEGLVRAIRGSNALVHARGKEQPEYQGMGTTYVSLGFTHDGLYVLHVGDSRAYRIRGERIEQLTHDHTLIQELVDSGALSESQAEHHPVSHMLTRSLGPTEEVTPDCWRMVDGPVRGDRFLLCSDGLYNLLSERDIAQRVIGLSDDEAVEHLVDEANARGGTDNITVMVISVGDNYSLRWEDLPESIRNAAASEDTLELDREELESTTAHLFQHSNGQDGRIQSPRIESTISLGEDSIIQPEDVQPEVTYGAELEHGADSNNGEYKSSSLQLSLGNGGRLPLMLGVIAASAVVYVAFLLGRGSAVRAPVNPSVTATPTPVVIEEEISSARVTEEHHENHENIEERAIEVGSESHELSPVIQDADIENSQVHGVESRQVYLRDLISRLELLLKSLSEPLKADIVPILNQTKVQIEESNGSLLRIREQLDIATRRLSVWIGRKQRLEVSDPLGLSLEVATVSEAVASAKKDFDRVTWHYLKEAEALRYEPNDSQKRESLRHLQQERSQKVEALNRAIRDAILKEIHESDREIAALSGQRDVTQAGIRTLEREYRVLNTILKGTTDEKLALRSELEKELQLAKTELQELLEGAKVTNTLEDADYDENEGTLPSIPGDSFSEEREGFGLDGSEREIEGAPAEEPKLDFQG
ncbi:MAG: protein phosphatase 2C domain-containing protein [Bdellovibrionales bacterium]|nr:protein phosphatase 2C domain-containing protein [Bdellovibrionales bacterium]